MALQRPVAALRRSARTAAPTTAPVVGAEGGELDAGLTGEINRKRGSGDKLPEQVSAGLGELSQAASTVRIHDDADSDRLAQSLSAKAFTVGNDVFFAAGQYQPDTEEGQHTLAHEVAHAANGENATRRISRKYNLRVGKPTGLMGTEHVRPFGPRTVWQFTDKSGDRIVVKMENQPLGLGDLAAAVHKSVGKTDTVITKQLTGQEEQQARGVISDPRKATGDKWKDAGADVSEEVMGKMKADFNDPNDWGRWVTVHDKLLQTDPMIAMSIAPGESAEALLDVNKATAQNAGTSPFKTVLERKSTTTKLGELSAIDLFLGNDDRVLGGNLGNWFYKPDEAMTVIDNVNQNMSDDKGEVEHRHLPMLYTQNLADTAQQLAESMKRQVKSTYGLYDKDGKQSVDDWFNAQRRRLEHPPGKRHPVDVRRSGGRAQALDQDLRLDPFQEQFAAQGQEGCEEGGSQGRPDRQHRGRLLRHPQAAGEDGLQGRRSFHGSERRRLTMRPSRTARNVYPSATFFRPSSICCQLPDDSWAASSESLPVWCSVSVVASPSPSRSYWMRW